MKPVYPCASLRWLPSIPMLAAISTLLAGCFWQGSQPKPPPTPPVVVAEAPQPAPSEPPLEPPIESQVASPPAEQPPAESMKETPPAEPPVPTEKLLLLGAQGPLIVEFEFWIDGQPQAQVFDELLDEVLKLADTDGDGMPTWQEVTTSPRFKYGQFGNLAIDRENAPKQIIQQYDTNGNGYVERNELPRFLTRNAGGSRAFSVRSAELYHNQNLRGSPAWEAIDVDDDGELSAAELTAATAQLRLRDADDDEIIVLDELRPTIDMNLMENMRSRGKFGDFARLLGEHANWNSVRSALEQRYALGGTIRAEDFRQMKDVFAHLDEDQSGAIERKEFPRLDEIPAHLRLRIDFGTSGKSEEEAASVASIKLVSSRLTEAQTGGQPPQVIEHPSRVVLRWPGGSLTFARNDSIANIDYEAQAEQGVKQFDANNDGYLEASEVNEQVQAQFARFEALDGDEDGKVYPGEVAAFLKQRQGAQRAQIHARGQDQEDALFLALDQNADERLDAQELDQAADRLRQLDRDGDGAVTPDELTEGIAIVIARGSVENVNQLFALAPVDVRPASGDVPSWFAAMDTSRDGVISAREFLGSPEKFAALDKNQNGFFEPSEIPTAPTTETEPASTTPAQSTTDTETGSDS